MFRSKLQKSVAPILVFVSLLVIGSQSGSASLITFTFSGNASGTIGGSSFNNAAFEITILGDTNNVEGVPGFPNSIRILSDSASITIAGMTSSITPQLSVFSNNTGFAGLALPPITDLILGPDSTQFSTWGMTTSIGPITSEASFESWNTVNIDTSSGQLIFAEGDVTTTFTAVVVPEPGSCMIICLGSLLVLRRRRSV